MFVFKVRLVTAFMCKSLRNFHVQGDRDAGQHSVQVKIAKIFKPAFYRLELHGGASVEEATKAHGSHQAAKVVAPIAAKRAFGLESPMTKVVPGLRGRGIAQRWVQSLQREQSKGDASKEITVNSTTVGVRTSRSGFRTRISAGADKSWWVSSV